MQQVPADRVIAELASRLGELHRENAILKVQIAILQETAITPAPVIPVPAPPGDNGVNPPPTLS